MSKISFHGGCEGCTRQDVEVDTFCGGCCYFDADWSLPNLNTKPISDADIARKGIKNKIAMDNLGIKRAS